MLASLCRSKIENWVPILRGSKIRMLMRGTFTGLLVAWLLLLSGCQSPERPLRLEPSSPLPRSERSPTPSVRATPSPSSLTLTVWGPLEFAPQAPGAAGEALRAQGAAFEAAHPAIRVQYAAKPGTGPASILNYLNAASAVAPTVLPDLIVLPAGMLAEVAGSRMVFPLDELIAPMVRDDLFPFAVRDSQVEGQWVAVPLAVQVEHGVTRSDRRVALPATLDGLVPEGAPTWLFAGAPAEAAGVSTAFLLQLLALTGEMPSPEALPPREAWVGLLATLQAAQEQGSISAQVLEVADSALLYPPLRTGEVDMIQSDSRQYGTERARGRDIVFAPLPTLGGSPASIVDGLLLVVATRDPARQTAAAEYIRWLLVKDNLDEWYRATYWLPPSRSTLAQVVEDPAYRRFLVERLENGWLRPGGGTWAGFAQAVQAQFGSVLTGQSTPEDAVDGLLRQYAP